jgi:hypothetical protein
MKAGKLMSITLAGLLIVLAATQGFCGDFARIFRSSVCPGMGHLGDGRGEIANASTLKGLGFLSLEVVCLSLTFSELSHMNSSARATAYLEAEYRMANTYGKRDTVYKSWKTAFDKTSTATMMTAAFGGAAVVVWGLNILDIVMFKPKQDDSEASILRNIRENTALTFNGNQASLAYYINF